MLNKWLRSEAQKELKIRAMEAKSRRMENESELLQARIKEMKRVTLPDHLMACCAYLWGCSEREVAPSYQDSYLQGFRVHASALQSVINDAVSSGMARGTGEGRILCKGGSELHRLAMLWREKHK